MQYLPIKMTWTIHIKEWISWYLLPSITDLELRSKMDICNLLIRSCNGSSSSPKKSVEWESESGISCHYCQLVPPRHNSKTRDFDILTCLQSSKISSIGKDDLSFIKAIIRSFRFSGDFWTFHVIDNKEKSATDYPLEYHLRKTLPFFPWWLGSDDCKKCRFSILLSVRVLDHSFSVSFLKSGKFSVFAFTMMSQRNSRRHPKGISKGENRGDSWRVKL